MPAGLADGLTRKETRYAGAALPAIRPRRPLAAFGSPAPWLETPGIRLCRAWNRSERSHRHAARVAPPIRPVALCKKSCSGADRPRCLGGYAEMRFVPVGPADLPQDAQHLL